MKMYSTLTISNTEISNNTTEKDLIIMIRFVKSLSIIVGLFLVSIVFNYAYEYKIEKVRKSSMYSLSTATVEARMKQLDCLATNIYHEAKGESFEGKVAVAQVTLNRVDSGKFPNDVCKVVYQKNVVYDKILCQFSWYCDGTPGIKVKNNQAYSESMEAAKKVLLEGFRLPSLENAMYYHGDYIDPNWNKEKIVKIGNHIFYSDRPASSNKSSSRPK